MQIRTLLLLLSIAGAVGSALSVWYVGTLKEDAQKKAETDLRWNIYQDAWQRIGKEEIAAFSEYSNDRQIFHSF